MSDFQEGATPLLRKPHHVTIEFDIDVAPELAGKIRDCIGYNMDSFLGYPTDVLGQSVYSFNRPNAPKQVKVTIQENDNVVVQVPESGS